MKYFRNPTTQEVFGYEEREDTQIPLMENAIADGYSDITGSWPPALPISDAPAKPTIEQLRAQLSTIQAQINALISNS